MKEKIREKLRTYLREDSGLHGDKLKKLFADSKVLEPLCEVLLESTPNRGTILSALAENSRKQAEPRHGGYRLMRHSAKLVATNSQSENNQSTKNEKTDPTTKAPALEESRLERAVWLRWRPDRNNPNMPPFLKDVAPKVLAYQVPLFAKKLKSGWGYIDLLGVSTGNLPVVIELKAGGSDESPLRMLLEATSYAIALREVWVKRAEQSMVSFRDEWCKALEDAGIEFGAINNQDWAVPTIVCLGADEYWDRHKTPLTCAPLREIVHTLRSSEIQINATFAKLKMSAETFH